MTTGEFTPFTIILRPILRQHLTITILDVLRQLGPVWIHRYAYCLKIYAKICKKIISWHHNFCLKMILWHILGQILRQYLWIWTQGCGLGLDVSVSRRSRDVPTSRLGLVSKKTSTSRSRLDLGRQTSRSRPFTSRAQDQFSAKLCRPQYAVWTDFRHCKPIL